VKAAVKEAWRKMKFLIDENTRSMESIRKVYKEKTVFLEDILKSKNSNIDINLVLNINGDIFDTTMVFSQTTLFFNTYCHSAYNPVLIIICHKLLAAYASSSIVRDVAYGKLVLVMAKARVSYNILHALDAVMQLRRRNSRHLLERVIGHRHGGIGK
jgi:hypothetical protein